MDKDYHEIFNEYLNQHLEDTAIDFEPLLKQNTSIRNFLEEKIRAYRQVVNAFKLNTGTSLKPPKEGDIIGNCRLDEMIGHGGMGYIYRATQQSLNREVVIKVLHPQVLKKSDSIGRFRRESLVIAKLEHEYIIPIFDVGEERGFHFIVMPHINGISLDDIVKLFADKKTTPSLEEVDHIRQLKSQQITRLSQIYRNYTEFVCSTISKIATAISYAHGEGILHRDIKPSNILIKPNGQPVLLDFGISRDINALRITQTGEYLGTPVYSAPEQLFGKSTEIDIRSDVYSLGVTLYELITGHLPFEGESIVEVVNNIKTKIPTNPKKYISNISNDLSTIILKATNIDRHKRYDDALMLRDDIQAFLNFNPIKAKLPSLGNRFKMFLIANKFKIGAALFVTILLLIAFRLIVWPYYNEKEVNNLFSKSDAAFTAGDFEGNSLILQKILAIDKNNTKAMIYYVENLHRLGKMNDEQILNYLDDKIKDNPNDAGLRFSKGIVLIRMGRSDEVVPMAEAAISDSTASNVDPLILANTCKFLVRYYLNKNDFVNAGRISIDKCIKFLPNNVDINVLAYDYCRSVGNVGCEIDYMLKAANISNNSLYYRKLALSLIQIGKNEQGLEYYRKSADLNPQDAWSYHGIALACLNLHDFECAEKAISEAITIEPNDKRFGDFLNFIRQSKAKYNRSK